jgi:tyrosyl-tRNA synthetase
MLSSGGVSLNKSKITDLERMITASDLIQSRYVIIQKGKKNYFLVKAE